MACLRGSRCTKLPEACFLVGTVLGAFVLEGTPFAWFSTGTFTSFLGEGHEKKRGGAILHPVVITYHAQGFGLCQPPRCEVISGIISWRLNGA